MFLTVINFNDGSVFESFAVRRDELHDRRQVLFQPLVGVHDDVAHDARRVAGLLQQLDGDVAVDHLQNRSVSCRKGAAELKLGLKVVQTTSSMRTIHKTNLKVK